VVEAEEDHLKIHPNWRKVVELQIHFLKNPSVQAVEAFQVVHAMVQKMYFQMEGVDSNFLLSVSHFHFYFVSSMGEVFAVALSLAAFLS